MPSPWKYDPLAEELEQAGRRAAKKAVSQFPVAENPKSTMAEILDRQAELNVLKPARERRNPPKE
jgi:hypothetical protein